jgi:hypothetical protein
LERQNSAKVSRTANVVKPCTLLISLLHKILLSAAMQIAMEYVRAVGLAEKFNNPEALVATGISTAWESGVRHPIALANAGIVCAERTANLGRLPSMYVRLV